MKKNQLGTSDIYISELTLGCMSLGTDKKNAANMIDYALENGINHLDTADLYGFGKNEEIVGEAIKNRRQDIILTTKGGNHFNSSKEDWFWDASKTYIMQAAKESLKRLQTNYIDFYMLHGGTIDDPIDETIEAFEQLKKEGTIRAYGISSIRPNVIREYVQKSHIDGVMMQYSMLDRRPEEEMLDLLHQNQISVLSRGPLANGMLSNKATKQVDKKAQEGYLDYSYEEMATIIKHLTALIDESDMDSFNTTALKYVLKHPAIASAVFGASSMGQITDNLAASNVTSLPEDTYQAIKEITKPITYTNHRS